MESQKEELNSGVQAVRKVQFVQKNRSVPATPEGAPRMEPPSAPSASQIAF